MTLGTSLPISGWSKSSIATQALLRWSLLVIGLVALLFVQSVRADVAIRVQAQAQPVTDPIQAFVTVTDASGNPVGGLDAADFTVKLDTKVLSSPTFSLPPAAPGSTQHVSIVFAMDYSPSVVDTSLAAMQEAVITFINSMKVGDYAAIVKFNKTNPNKASVVQQFVQIDGVSGPNRTALIAAVNSDYPGRESNVLDAVLVSVDAFNSPAVTLPSGPRAIVLVSDGAENSSSANFNTALQSAIDANVSIFTVGVGDFTSTTSQRILNNLPTETGGDFYPTSDAATIAGAYVQISQLLNNEYLLAFVSDIADCNTHTLEVQVTGQAAATANFTRCTTLFVPDLGGMTVAEATTALAYVGMIVGTQTQQPNQFAPVGTVLSQSPSLGAVATSGGKVNLVLSSGPAPVAVPNVVGMTEAAARTAITGAGLKVGTVTRQTSSGVTSGNVISQTPAGATQALTGSSVDLVISSGAPKSSGGGGGATGPLEVLAGLLLASFLRRRRSA